MISFEEFRLLEENLIQTYQAIAKGIPGTELISGDGWIAAVNPFNHPICNFAVCEDKAGADTRGLRCLAAPRLFFNLYVCHYDGMDCAHETLDEGGFQRLYTLTLMARSSHERADVLPPIKGIPELVRADSQAARRRISEYMAAQFFATQSDAVRQQIAHATQDRAELKLYELAGVETVYGPIGAVMLHSTPGVLGLYNLCISMPLRSKGYGSWIVLSIESLAMRESVILGLQCDPGLAAWYRGLGLEQVGTVDVYGLNRSVSYNERY